MTSKLSLQWKIRVPNARAVIWYCPKRPHRVTPFTVDPVALPNSIIPFTQTSPSHHISVWYSRSSSPRPCPWQSGLVGVGYKTSPSRQITAGSVGTPNVARRCAERPHRVTRKIFATDADRVPNARHHSVCKTSPSRHVTAGPVGRHLGGFAVVKIKFVAEREERNELWVPREDAHEHLDAYLLEVCVTRHYARPRRPD